MLAPELFRLRYGIHVIRAIDGEQVRNARQSEYREVAVPSAGADGDAGGRQRISRHVVPGGRQIRQLRAVERGSQIGIIGLHHGDLPLDRHGLGLSGNPEHELDIGHLAEADRHFLHGLFEALGVHRHGVDAGPEQRKMEVARGAGGRGLHLTCGVALQRHFTGGHVRPAWIGHGADKLTRDR